MYKGEASMEGKMTENKDRKISCLAAFIGFAAALALDQLTKYLAVLHLKDQAPFVIIDGVFELHYLENRGAAFGLMQNMQFIFVIGAVLVFAVVIVLYRRIPLNNRFLPLRICAVLLCAGAAGNMIDRLRLNYVIDFFYFKLIDFPIFNVADCYVVAACIVFVLLVLFFYKDEDFEFLGQKKADKGRQGQ